MMNSITGHFAICHSVTAVLPTPSASPTAVASGPDTTRATAVRATSTMQTKVMKSWSGSFFQKGRPSSTSQMLLAASVKAPT
jgi:hypothetical protein